MLGWCKYSKNKIKLRLGSLNRFGLTSSTNLIR
jgi:hypothetical protein